MIKTKIIVTYGPAISEEQTLQKVLKNTDIVRINFSHMDQDYWLDAAKRVKDTAAKLGKDIAILADLPGPKVRLASFDAPIKVKKGELVVFSPNKSSGSIQVMYEDFHKKATIGTIIDIGDGDLNFTVTAIKDDQVTARAMNEGALSSRKGVSFVGRSMGIPAPTKSDVELAKFAIKKEFTFIGMSFVQAAQDVLNLRKQIGEAQIVAKIETKEAVKNIQSIAEVVDGIMVARGDLATRVSIEYIPEVQLRIIEAARAARKPVIVATQLLTSMINNPAPTRAEANDIANAVREGADCLMLSDETIVGKHPVEAVDYLVRITQVAEKTYPASAYHHRNIKNAPASVGIAYAAAEMAERYETDCIYVPTQSGSTAKMVSSLRPNTEIRALVIDEKIMKQLSLYYGVRSKLVERYNSMDQMLQIVAQMAKQSAVKKYIVVSGTPNKPGGTDTLKYIDGR